MSEPSLSPWCWLTVGPAREISTIDHYTMCVLIIAARVEQLFQRGACYHAREKRAARIYCDKLTIDTLPL